MFAASYYEADEEGYPDEWVYVDGYPTCTRWKAWDWEVQGIPDDPPVKRPNQPAVFYLMDAIKSEE